jgi:hypothetical protein
MGVLPVTENTATFNCLKNQIHLNDTNKFSFYLTENTLHQRYEDQPNNGVDAWQTALCEC